MKTLKLMLTASAVLSAASWLLAQSYSIDWWTADGGGGTSTGGVYAVSGTIGQADPGRMQGGQFALDGGFWSMAAGLQMPGAPLLSIRQTNGTVVVSWPLPETVWWLLEQTHGLSAGANVWTLVPPPYVTNAQGISVTLPAAPGSTFFRLVALPSPQSPILTGVTPDHGPVQGGNVVTVLGGHFQFNAQVKFGGAQASGVLVSSDSALSCVVPAQAGPGTYDVTIINPDGQSYTKPNAYTYQ